AAQTVVGEHGDETGQRARPARAAEAVEEALLRARRPLDLYDAVGAVIGGRRGPGLRLRDVVAAGIDTVLVRRHVDFREVPLGVIGVVRGVAGGVRDIVHAFLGIIGVNRLAAVGVDRLGERELRRIVPLPDRRAAGAGVHRALDHVPVVVESEGGVAQRAFGTGNFGIDDV